MPRGAGAGAGGSSTQSQMTSSSTPNRSANNSGNLDFSADDFDKFAADAVFFILVQEKKRGTIKKPDLMKVGGGNCSVGTGVVFSEMC
jgi:hypothetical protein